MEQIDAAALGGASAFGLEAGGGVQAWLAKRGRGFRIREAVIPIVPGAIMFDLLNGGKGLGPVRTLSRSRLHRGGG
jgi:L-aminopeptidase/D-esterase-like protein